MIKGKFPSARDEFSAIALERKERQSDLSAYPTLSVLISTARPSDLLAILAQLEKQTLAQFELVIGLHDFALTPEHLSSIKALESRNIHVVTESFDKSRTLGEILTSLGKLSQGEFIAKMDDDDIYGPHHLSDLLEIIVIKQADAVGRAMNFVYIEALDLTVRRMTSKGISMANVWSDWVCGGTILAKRQSAEAAGWFGSGKRAVDTFILQGIKTNGGNIWRTYGAGYIYRRSVGGQTYVTNYSKYLRANVEQRVGIWAHDEFGTGH